MCWQTDRTVSFLMARPRCVQCSAIKIRNAPLQQRHIAGQFTVKDHLVLLHVCALSLLLSVGMWWNAGKSYVFDIQRTMREAYDKARRVLFDCNSESSRNENCTAPAHKSSHVDVTSCAASLSSTGHSDGCLATCTCFLVCTLLRLFCALNF